MHSLPYIALVGSPNSGKTVIFNQLTGLRHKVANYPGVTVEKKEAPLHLPGKDACRLVDLPGIYSLKPKTLDEQTTLKVLKEGFGEGRKPELIIFVLDATLLSRQLVLLLELQSLNLPVVVALNMMDLAKARGFKHDTQKLSQALGCPVIPVVATKNQGLAELKGEIAHYLDHKKPLGHSSASSLKTYDFLKNLNPKQRLQSLFKQAQAILKEVESGQIKESLWTRRLDRVLIHPVWGTLLLALILALLFQAIFTWAEVPMDWIDGGLGALATALKPLLGDTPLGSLVTEGIIPGVGSVLVFLPQILFLFLVLFVLEDSGYMARAAFLMDRHMARAGLNGRAFIPLLSSFACAIPGIMGARTIENQRERLITIFVSPLMPCSARLPVYILLISAFIPNQKLWGPFNLQGLVLFGLYVLGVLSGMTLAWVLSKVTAKKDLGLFLLELPTYKWPQFKTVFLKMFDRAWLFVKRAGTVILLASLVLWFLSSFPKSDSNVAPTLEQSYAGQVGQWIEPVVRPLGFDDKIAVGLLTGMVAREVIVGSLATLYSVEEGQNGQEVESKLSNILKNRWSKATGLSLLIFFVFAMQCTSTLAVVYRETASIKYPVLMFAVMSFLAYGASWITYRVCY